MAVGMVRVCSIPVVMRTTSDSGQKLKTDVKKN